MNKHELSQLRNMNKEIDLLQKQIAEIKPGYVMDSVTGSSKHFPYTVHTIRIEGIDTYEYDRKIKRLKERLKRRYTELLDKRTEIEEFIEAIDDSLMRQIITLRYVKGLSWDQVATDIGGRNSADGVRIQHDRFIKKL